MCLKINLAKSLRRKEKIKKKLEKRKLCDSATLRETQFTT